MGLELEFKAKKKKIIITKFKGKTFYFPRS